MPISKEREITIITTDEIKPDQNNRLLFGYDLNFNGVSTQHATHALHPYVAAINPPLARKLMEVYVPAQGKVLDPFCGGGGVLVESILSGRDCAGFDINPLAALIAKAKTTWIPRDLIIEEYRQIYKRAKESVGKVEPKISDNAKYWFNERTIDELAAFTEAIKKCQDPNLKALFSIVVSFTARSVMLTYRGEVRLRKLTGKDLEKFKPDTFTAFTEKSQIAIQRVPQLPKYVNVQIEALDARNLPLNDNSFHSIICSPPYADDTNGVGYFQFSRYMLEWLGMSPQEINKYKNQFLGSNIKGKILQQSKTLTLAAENIINRSERHYKQLVAFYSDYFEVLKEMKRVVTDFIIIVIGNRILSRTLIDNANITCELFEEIGGVKLVDYYTRTISKKRIPNLGGDGGGINKEHILILKKH